MSKILITGGSGLLGKHLQEVLPTATFISSKDYDLTSEKEVILFLKQRKGFIKYALKYGYTIRPVFIMNEHKAFKTYEGLKSFRLLLNRVKIPGVIYWNPSTGPCFPANYRLDTIIGKAIGGKRAYNEGEDPSPAEIEELHAVYMKEVMEMYERHK